MSELRTADRSRRGGGQIRTCPTCGRLILNGQTCTCGTKLPTDRSPVRSRALWLSLVLL